MRVSKVGKITPHSGRRPQLAEIEGQSDSADRQRIWQELAPRLIHPTKIEIIEALSWVGEPLSVSEFHAALAPSEFRIDYVRYHLKGLCRAGVVMEVPDLAASHPRERRYSFNWLADTGEQPKR